MSDDLVRRLRAVVPMVYDAHDAADEIERLQTRVAELEDTLSLRTNLHGEATHLIKELEAREEAAEALLSEAVKAGMLEGEGLSIQMSEKRESEQTSSFDDTATHEADFGGQIAEAIRGAASDPETIARIVAQLKESRG